MKHLISYALVLTFLIGCSQPKLTEAEIQEHNQRVLQEAEKPQYKISKLENITVIGANWCPGCRNLKKFLEDDNIPYTYIDYQADAETKKIYAKFEAVPIVILNKGLDEEVAFTGEKTPYYFIANAELIESYKAAKHSNIELPICTPDGHCE